MKTLGFQRMLGVSTVLAALGARGMPAISTSGKVQRGRMVHSGSTLNARRNAEKRAAKAAQKRYRLSRLAIRSGFPKINCAERIGVLSDRRLRQRSVARG